LPSARRWHTSSGTGTAWAVLTTLPIHSRAFRLPAPAQAAKRAGFTSFPPYLLVAMLRYYTTEAWEARKRDVEVPVPEQVDLEPLRAPGLQVGRARCPSCGLLHKGPACGCYLCRLARARVC
jgi:hypothetical protein